MKEFLENIKHPLTFVVRFVLLTMSNLRHLVIQIRKLRQLRVMRNVISAVISRCLLIILL